MTKDKLETYTVAFLTITTVAAIVFLSLIADYVAKPHNCNVNVSVNNTVSK